MNINDILNEIEYYESVGKHKLADRLSNRLYSYAVQFTDTISKMEGSGVFNMMQRQKMIEEIHQFMQHPACQKCFGMINQPQILGDFKDLAAEASQPQKTPEQQREEYTKFFKWYNETEAKMTDLPPNVSEEGRRACTECISLIKKGRISQVPGEAPPADQSRVGKPPAVLNVVPQMPSRS